LYYSKQQSAWTVAIIFTGIPNTVSAEFIGQTSVPYKRIGKHLDLINSNNTPANFPKNAIKILLKSRFVFLNEHLNFVELSKKCQDI